MEICSPTLERLCVGIMTHNYEGGDEEDPCEVMAIRDAPALQAVVFDIEGNEEEGCDLARDFIVRLAGQAPPALREITAWCMRGPGAAKARSLAALLRRRLGGAWEVSAREGLRRDPESARGYKRAMEWENAVRQRETMMGYDHYSFSVTARRRA